MAKRTASFPATAIRGGSVEAMSRSRGAVMTRRRFVLSAAAVAVAPALAGCNSLERAAGTDIDAPWRMSSSMPGDPGNAHSEWLAAFKDAVGGALRVDYYPDSQLGDEAKSVPQVRIGAVDLMISGSSIWSTVVPEFGLLDMGYLFDNWDDVAAALDGDVGSALARRLRAKTGLEIIGWPFNFGVRNVLSTRPVARPDDLKGLKVRTLPAPEVVETLDLMGAVATPIPIGEVYTSLQTGLIDGLEHDAPTIENNKYYEVAKDLALTRHLFTRSPLWRTATVSRRCPPADGRL